MNDVGDRGDPFGGIKDSIPRSGSFGVCGIGGRTFPSLVAGGVSFAGGDGGKEEFSNAGGTPEGVDVLESIGIGGRAL
jgi:hypothetical protein